MKNLLSLGVSAFLFMACSDTGSVFEVPLPGSLDSEEPVSSSSIVKKSSASKSKEDSESNKGEDKSEYNSSTGILKDLRDGQTYKTVEIGEGEKAQIWMAENLNYAYKVSTAKFDSSSFCYDNDPKNCEKYGRLYLWSALPFSVMLEKGVVTIQHVNRHRLFAEFVLKVGICLILWNGIFLLRR